MIKISDQFSAKMYASGWELHNVTPSTNEKSKTGWKVDVTFHGNFALLGKAVIDKSIGDCETLEEVLTAVEAAGDLLASVIKKNKIDN